MPVGAQCAKPYRVCLPRLGRLTQAAWCDGLSIRINPPVLPNHLPSKSKFYFIFLTCSNDEPDLAERNPVT